MLANCMLFCHMLFFFLSKNLRNTARVSNSLGLDQAQHFVGPDQDPTISLADKELIIYCLLYNLLWKSFKNVDKILLS